MNAEDAQVLEDVLSDLEDIREDIRVLRDDDAARRVHLWLDNFEDHVHGLLRRRPRVEAPLVVESSGHPVDTPLGLDDDNLVPGVDY